ncbi:MAG: GFA family protein [Pseudomonadota bacterium]|nr:GFA family protein [Pseudomonadota bacterium]
MKIEGGCYCGAIRYESTGEPQGALQCHCRECQYITGGHPNVIMIVPASGFRFTKGEPASFTRSDLERPVTRLFCPTCGTAIGTRTPNRPDSVILKVGTMDHPEIFEPKAAIFTIDRQPFHHIPDGIPTFERRLG